MNVPSNSMSAPGGMEVTRKRVCGVVSAMSGAGVAATATLVNFVGSSG